METHLTASSHLFNPDSKVIFFFEERIGEITEKGKEFFAETIGNKKATFKTYNTACDFLKRCYERIERRKFTQSDPDQCTMLF